PGARRREKAARSGRHVSGGGEIRTPEGLRPSGFQDRCLKPGSATPPWGPRDQPALASGCAARVGSAYQLADGLQAAHGCAHGHEVAIRDPDLMRRDGLVSTRSLVTEMEKSEPLERHFVETPRLGCTIRLRNRRAPLATSRERAKSRAAPVIRPASRAARR